MKDPVKQWKSADKDGKGSLLFIEFVEWATNEGAWNFSLVQELALGHDSAWVERLTQVFGHMFIGNQ